jgi:hypothetical protein
MMSKRKIKTKTGHGLGEYELSHNPGYDFMRLAKWLENADPTNEDLPFAPYFIPPLALIAACCAIEGYINMIGLHVDDDWANFDKGRVTLKERVERIYESVGKTPVFGKGILQTCINLFQMRGALVHPRYVNKSEVRDSDIPDMFDEVEAIFPPAVSRQLAEDVIALLLKDTDVEHLKEHWRFGGYSQKI